MMKLPRTRSRVSLSVSNQLCIESLVMWIKSFYCDKESESCSAVSDSLRPHGLWYSPAQNTEVGSLSLIQGIFPTQGSNPGLPHSWRILYQLSHKGSPRVLEWVAYPFSVGFFPTQESNRGLLHCRRILYQLCYEGSQGKCSCQIR